MHPAFNRNQVGSTPTSPPKCSCSPIGRGDRLKPDLCVSSNLTGSTNTCSCGGIGRRGRLKICSFFVGSTPTRSINGMWRSLVARLLWEQDVAGSNPAIPIYPCDAIGRHRLLRISVFAGSNPARGTDFRLQTPVAQW